METRADTLEDLAAGILDTTVDVDHTPSADELKLLAFRLWCFDAARDPATVSRLIEERTGVTVEPRTIRKWSSGERWAVAAVDFGQMFSETSRSTVDATLMQGVVKAVRWMVDSLTDDSVPAAVKLRSAVAILDRGGYAPVYKSLGITVHGRQQSGAFVDVSDDELEAAISSYTRDGRGVAPDPDVTSIEVRTSVATMYSPPSSA